MLYRTLLVVVVLLLAACQQASEPTTVPSTQISVQLSWLDTIEFAGFYEAVEQGYYTNENLSVNLTSGGFDADGNVIDPVNQVVSGEADFGVIDSGTLLVARASGTPIVAVAAIYQRSPVAFVSMAEKEITAPENMIGATVAIDPVTTGTVYQALLTAQGIAPEEINQVQRTDFTIAPLVNGEADVIDGWVTNEVVSLSLAGHEVNVILASDYGIDMYPNVIFTTEELIANNPALVESFLGATLSGITKAIEDPEGAARLAVARSQDLDAEAQIEAMNRSLPLLNPAGSQPGMMQAEAWEFTYQTLVEQGGLSESVEVEAAYDMRFLEKIYQAA